MAKKKEKRFVNVEKIIETYFPAYSEREKESSVKDEDQIGTDLAVQLAKEFQTNLQQ